MAFVWTNVVRYLPLNYSRYLIESSEVANKKVPRLLINERMEKGQVHTLYEER